MDTIEPMTRTTPIQSPSSVGTATITSTSQVEPSTSGQIQLPHSEHCKSDLPILTHQPQILVTATSQLEPVSSTSSGQIQPLKLCRTVETARNIFVKEIIPMFFQENLCRLVVTTFHLHCDISWVCTDHCSHLVDDMFTRIALLFIRRQCQKVNRNLAAKEEELSDANKRGEQYGAVK